VLPGSLLPGRRAEERSAEVIQPGLSGECAASPAASPRRCRAVVVHDPRAVELLDVESHAGSARPQSDPVSQQLGTGEAGLDLDPGRPACGFDEERIEPRIVEDDLLAADRVH
jgi:hypothetical protein